MAHAMAQDEERLRSAVCRDTADLREAIDTLQSAARRRISAFSMDQRPYTWLAGALVLGWMMGSRLR